MASLDSLLVKSNIKVLVLPVVRFYEKGGGVFCICASCIVEAVVTFPYPHLGKALCFYKTFHWCYPGCPLGSQTILRTEITEL